MRPALAAALAAATLLAPACGDRDGPDPPPEAPAPGSSETAPDAERPSEDASEGPDGLVGRDRESRLLLVREVPLGLRYAEVRERLPALGPALPETPGGAAGGEALTEAVLSTRLFGHPARLELNFERDTLYSFYYMLGNMGCDEARGVYRRLRRFYADRYGEGREETQREPGYITRSTYWDAEDHSVAGTLGSEGEVCRLGWGFQARTP